GRAASDRILPAAERVNRSWAAGALQHELRPGSGRESGSPQRPLACHCCNRPRAQNDEHARPLEAAALGTAAQALVEPESTDSALSMPSSSGIAAVQHSSRSRTVFQNGSVHLHWCYFPHIWPASVTTAMRTVL